MRLREPVTGEALEFAEDGARNLDRDTARFGSIAELIPHLQHSLGRAFAGHGAAEGIGLSSGKARERHGDLHHLFLIEDDAVGFLEHGDQIGVVVMRLDGKEAGAFPLAVLDIGFDGAADDGTRTHDGDLHDKILQFLRTRSWKHLDLGATLDLEDADGVAFVDHFVDGGVFEVDPAEIDRRLSFLGNELQAFLDEGKHAEGEEVDFHHAGVFAGVLVPLGQESAFHGRGLHGHQAADG
ncbi:MAG: hypothetical protein R2848_06060 [Thermomicrobiales bacterium]